MSTEYKRPTADATGSFTSCAGISLTMTTTTNSLSGVYTSKSGNGPTGSANAMVSLAGGTPLFLPTSAKRVFSSWQSAGGSYTSLILYMSVGGVITGSNAGGSVCAEYSTNAGSTWSTLYLFSGNGLSVATDSQHTVSATITGTSLSNLQVRVASTGVGSGTAPPDTGTINVYDIWTAGVLGGSKKLIKCSIM